MKSEMHENLAQLFGKLDTIEYGDIILASGKHSHYKIFADKVLFHEIGRDLVAEIAMQKLPVSGYKLAGVYSGGWEFAKIMSEKTGAYTICTNSKNNTISRGSVEKDDYVIMLEDVTTSGGSVAKCAVLARSFGAVVDKAIAIVDREEGAVDNLAKMGIRLEPILTKRDLGIKAI